MFHNSLLQKNCHFDRSEAEWRNLLFHFLSGTPEVFATPHDDKAVLLRSKGQIGVSSG